jgi:imidazoleglycerol-phosphate dehydratase
MKKRTATINRETKETKIKITVNIDGTGKYDIKTGIPFLNHMLELFSKHSLIDIDLKAKGDLEVDYHHTVEDIGLCMGMALSKAASDKRGIHRYGYAYAPMDDALSRVVIDFGGRAYLVYSMSNRKRKIRDFDLGLIEEFFRALTAEAGINVHITQFYGKDPHHSYESVFKAFAMAMRNALEADNRRNDIPSTKGTL